MKKLTITSQKIDSSVPYRPEFIFCREVLTDLELRECYAIRKKVFVDEQKLFVGSDLDQYDQKAIHIAAFCNNQIVGTVRVYQTEKEEWFGGRLAVLKGFRGRTGRLLIDKAIEIVKKKGAKRFFAYVQVKNIPLFIRYGWSVAGEVFLYHDVPHQLMELNLD